MPRLSPRVRGLLLAGLFTLAVTIWLAPAATQATGLGQGESPVSPNQTPTEQPTATETATAGETPVETAGETVTPAPDTPTPEPPTDTPIPDTPTDTPTETPSPTAALPTPTPTETPVPSPSPRPTLLPTLTPEPTVLDALEKMTTVALTSAAWIWLTCGSLLFFAVAGAFAGLSFYRQNRQRYDLYAIVPEEEAAPPRDDSRRSGDGPVDDDSWPSSLP